MNHKTPVKFALSLLLMGGLCATAFSQIAAAQVPAQSNPGAITPAPVEQTEEQKQKDAEKQLQAVPQPLPTETKIEVPEPSVDIPSEGAQTQSVFVKKIQVEGSTLFTEKEFAPLFQPYEGKTISMDDLDKAVEGINKLYRDKGYLTSQAYLAPQAVDQGNVVIQVTEGTVGNLQISGNRFYRSSYFTNRLGATEGELFNIKQLENELNHINGENNVRLRAVLTAGAETGETNVRIEVAERQPWQVSPTFDDQGRPFIGTMRGGVEMSNNSVFGFGDRLYTRYLGGAGTNVALGSYFVPVNKHGDEVGVSYGFSRVNVDLNTGAQPDIIGRAQNYGLMFLHPFDEKRTWVGDIGFNVREVTTEINGAQDTRNGIRSLQAGLNFDKFDSLGRTFGRVQNTVGIGFLGGNSEFWKTEGFLTRLFKLPMDNILMIRAYGQYSPSDLPSAEAFQLGGAYSVRGYTEGLILGDRGFSLTVEDRWPIPFLGHISPWLNERLQGAVFFDVGQAWLDSSNSRFVAGTSNRASRTFLMGTGFGLRMRLTQYLQGFADLGFGLVDRDLIEPNAMPTARLHFGVRSNLLPSNMKSWANTPISAIPTK